MKVAVMQGIDSMGPVNGYVPLWLKQEVLRANRQLVPPTEADLILLSYPGTLNFGKTVPKVLRRNGIEPDVSVRDKRPYVITGGLIAMAPHQALTVADALCAGEGYNFVRRVLACGSVAEVERELELIPNALTREQLLDYALDADRPHLLASKPASRIQLDDYIDWEMACRWRCYDGLADLQVSRGCRNKCAFCATSHYHPRSVAPLEFIEREAPLATLYDYMSFMSNNILDDGILHLLPARRFAASVCAKSLMVPDNRRILLARYKGLIRSFRIGVEGVSERLRHAIGKPVADDQLLDIIGWLTFDMNVAAITLFMISELPGETSEDYQAFKNFLKRLRPVLNPSRNRTPISVHFTYFTPAPPAPLARFLCLYDRSRSRELADWTRRNCKILGVRFWPHPGINSLVDRLAAVLVDPKLERRLIEQAKHGHGACYDLYPSVDDMERAPWAIYDFPIPVRKLWLRAESYKDRIGFATEVLA